MEEFVKSLVEQAILLEETLIQTIKVMEVFEEMVEGARNNPDMDIDRLSDEIDIYPIFDRIAKLVDNLSSRL